MAQTIQIEKRKRREPLPPWFRVRIPSGEKLQTYNRITDAVHGNMLHTVCEEAGCPNIHDCWGRGTATFMIGGKSCTRDCAFCSVEHVRKPPPPDPDEPGNLADAIQSMKLSYAVITVVNRDDLADEGAGHFRACLDAVQDRLPEVGLEILSGDLNGNEEALNSLLDGAPLKVFAHNVETVERLTPNIRDRKASFKQSLRILEAGKALRPELLTKSSIMVGLGETNADVSQTLAVLRSVGVELLTFGQYLAPGSGHVPVVSYPHPDQFDAWKQEALEAGFLAVASGPLVRSSFRAGLLYDDALGKRSSGLSV